MPPLGQTAGSDDERPPEDLAEAGVYATSRQGHDHGLVVLAMGLPYCLVAGENGFRLLVEPAQVEAVREQLAKYDRESVGWPPRAAVTKPVLAHLALGTPVIWALAVATVYWAQIEWPGWLENRGELEPQALFVGGEWWRPLTALFLHADLMHLWSNLFPGMLIFAAVCATFGRRRGWLLLGLAAVAGNTAVAALSFPGPYRSLGASTAVFAGLGLLTGRAVRLAWRSEPNGRWREVFIPLGAGFTLLALHGAGGPRTDVAAHLAGFAVGFLAGVLAAWRQAHLVRAEEGEN
jgi:membrane associated rhomboid family serine protease